MHAIRLLTALLVISSLPACYAETETVYVVVPEEGGSVGGVDEEYPRQAIDSDAELTDLAPGLETGLYVEYLSGGLWRLYTTCGDVELYGDCHWDVVTTVRDGEFFGVEPDGLEVGDWVDADAYGPWLDAYTGADFDGMFVQTTPGAGLLIDALLDGDDARDYLFWVSGGSAVYGATANPLELVPTIP